jgi:uncharacterized membrane protein YgcG
MGLKHYFAKQELLSVIIHCIIIFAVYCGLLFTVSGSMNGSYYDKVHINYEQKNDDLEITESFYINVGTTYNVLYRSFVENACLSNNCDMFIESVECEDGTPYFSSSYYPINPQTGDKISVPSSISDKFESNEVGCFKTNKYYSGSQEILVVKYKVPMSHVEFNKNIHYFMSNDHFSIKKLTINDINGNNHFYEKIPSDVQIKINVYDGYTKEYNYLFYVSLVVGILLSLIPFFVWRFFGQEKSFTVPQYLHFVPNKNMEPWQVDAMLNSRLTKNGFASILLNLYVKDVVRFENKLNFFTKKIIVYVKNNESNLTIKEEKLVSFFKSHMISNDGQFTKCELNLSDYSVGSFIQRYMMDGIIGKFIRSVMNQSGFYFALGISGVCFVGVFLSAMLSPVPEYFFVPLIGTTFVNIFVCIVLPSSIYSRFKNDNYKLYLEWLSFKNMLDDYASINKYLKEDYNQWKEWLVYGTALGSTKNLLKSMKELKILSAKDFESINTIHHSSIIFATTAVSSSSSSSGGSVGGGGGFGGGGGGGR